MKIFQIIHWLTKLFKLNNKSKVILFILMPLGILAQNNAAFWLGKRASGETDPYFSNVSLLLHMDGANGSTTFTDDSNNNFTVTRFGNAQISTAQSVFGGASGYFDGTGDYLSYTADVDFQFGTGDFTIEGWFYASNYNRTYNTLFSIGRYSDGIMLRRQALGTSGNDNLYINGTTYNWAPYNNLPLTTWTHIAIARSGTQVRVFVNGNVVLSVINSSSINPTNLTSIATATHAVNDVWFGHIDEFRITKGIARYTSNFTPPTAPFPNN